MLNRGFVAIIGIIILLGIYIKSGIYLLVFNIFISLVGINEFYKMVKNCDNKFEKYLGYIVAFAVPNIIYFCGDKKQEIIMMLLVILFITILSKRVLKNEIVGTTEVLGKTILGVVYVPILFSHVLLISKLQNGNKLLLAIQILVWVCDTFAYLVGRKLGRKFFERGLNSISPKKSIEGFIGGAAFTTLTLFIINQYFKILPVEFNNLIVIIFIGITISIVAQIGDLSESIFKREFSIKDSGKILGEHGGILDRFDSMLFVVPFMYYVLKYFY